MSSPAFRSSSSRAPLDPAAGTSAARLTLDRAIGSVDRAAGALIGDREIAKRGSDRVEHVAKVQATERLEQQATTLREQANETALTGTQQAAQKRRAGRHGPSRGSTRRRSRRRVASGGQGDSHEECLGAEGRRRPSRADDTATVERRKQRVNNAADGRKARRSGASKGLHRPARESTQRADKAGTDAERLRDLGGSQEEDARAG